MCSDIFKERKQNIRIREEFLNRDFTGELISKGY